MSPCRLKVLPTVGASLLALALLHAGAVPAAQAAQPAAPSPAAAASAPLSKGEIKAQRDFKMLDFNGDGQLSRKEVALFPRLYNAFDDADTDQSGLVSYEEVKAFTVKYRAERDRKRAEAAKEMQAAKAAKDAAAATSSPDPKPNSKP